MQVSTCVCNGTPFRLASPESRDAIQGLTHEHMDGYLVDFDEHTLPDGSVGCCLSMDTEDVGDSFRERLEKLIAALTPHVLDAFRVTVRTDSMSDDDRDLTLFGGPDNQTILDFQTQCAVKDAMELLRGVGLKAAMLQALLKDSELQGKIPAPKIFLALEGGVVQGGVVDRAAEVYVIDYDIEGCDPDQIVSIPQDPVRGSAVTFAEAIVSSLSLDINPTSFVQLDRAIQRGQRFLGFSADGYWCNDLGWVESPGEATTFTKQEAHSIKHLIGSGVCVLEVDPLTRGALPSVGDLSRVLEEFAAGSGKPNLADWTEKDKADLLELAKGHFPSGFDPLSFAPALFAIAERAERDWWREMEDELTKMRVTPRPS